MGSRVVVRLFGAWMPDDKDGDLADVEAYLEDDDVVLMVIEDDTGEVRIPLDELVELVETMQELHLKGQGDGSK